MFNLHRSYVHFTSDVTFLFIGLLCILHATRDAGQYLSRTSDGMLHVDVSHCLWSIILSVGGGDDSHLGYIAFED